MSNPFRSNTDNPYDRPLSLGGTSTSTRQTDHAVAYDPGTKTISPNGQAMVAMMMDQMRKELDETVKIVGQVIGDELNPITKRLEALERAVDAQGKDVANAIRTTVVGFLGEDDTPGEKRAMQQTKDYWKGKK